MRCSTLPLLAFTVGLMLFSAQSTCMAQPPGRASTNVAVNNGVGQAQSTSRLVDLRTRLRAAESERAALRSRYDRLESDLRRIERALQDRYDESANDLAPQIAELASTIDYLRSQRHLIRDSALLGQFDENLRQAERHLATLEAQKRRFDQSTARLIERKRATEGALARTAASLNRVNTRIESLRARLRGR